MEMPKNVKQSNKRKSCKQSQRGNSENHKPNWTKKKNNNPKKTNHKLSMKFIQSCIHTFTRDKVWSVCVIRQRP